MLHSHVGEYLYVAPEHAAVPLDAVRLALENALIGDACAGVDVDANKFGTARSSHRDCRHPIIAKHIEAERKADLLFYLASQYGHECYGVRGYAFRKEGRVAEVFQ